MSDINTLIRRLPQTECAFGGSHGGQIYQNYPWPPLDTLPAKRETTQQRLDFLAPLYDWEGAKALDIGCANGAISIGLSKLGANVTGWDWSREDLAVAKLAAKELGADVRFKDIDITGNRGDAQYDVVLYLSVWKWLAWRYSLETANETLDWIGRHTKVLIFESGITGTGIDLVKVPMDAIRPILEERFTKVEMVGTFPRDDQQVDRPVWVCS